jgi:carbon-monoxide dehydrogenase medium subunit
MKAATFDYVRPRDTSAALRALADAKGEAKLLAGGQSLGPMLNLRLARPKLVIDIARIDTLRNIEVRDGNVRIGAAATHTAIELARPQLDGAAMLADVAGDIAYRAVRNRGTIGGSLAHADPAADWPLALATLGATVHVEGPGGARTVAADQFMQAAFTTALREDEMITAIEIPRPSVSARWGYFKLCKRTGEFPEAAAAALFDPQQRIARIFVGALSGAPRALQQLAQGIAQQGATALTSTAIDRAIAAAAPELDAIARKMHAAAAMRALRQVVTA